MILKAAAKNQSAQVKHFLLLIYLFESSTNWLILGDLKKIINGQGDVKLHTLLITVL